MSRPRIPLLAVLALLMSTPLLAHRQTSAEISELPAAFVDRVWKVEESNAVHRGQRYVFLSDGTLVLASGGNRPAFGRWTFEDGVFTMIEEGTAYRTDILTASDEELRLHLHDPGAGVDLRLVPAVSCVAVASQPSPAAFSTATLAGSHWKLVEIAGSPSAAGIEATLDFTEEGKVSGRGSCNRFFGEVRVAGDTLKFGALGATKMACGAAADLQEGRYLQALAASVRFHREAESLELFADAGSVTLRFAPREP